MRDRLASEYSEELLFLDPAETFDACILGVGYRCGDEPVVIYDASKCVDALMATGMTDEEALEHFHFNIAGAYVGPHTPMFLEWPIDRG